MQKDVRWKQRFQNFERAFVFFNKSCKLEIYDELQGAGLVQSFEFTFELAWKTLKDYLQDQGLVREAYKHWTNGSYPRTSKYHTHYPKNGS